MQKALAYIRRHPTLQEAAVFALFLALYLPLQRGDVFADPDSFYHLKMAELTAAHGPVRDFLWLPFTTLAHRFADHHFLYHVLLIPFVKLIGPLGGMKIATAVFAALAVGVFAWAARRLGVRYGWAYALALGIMNPFVFRIGLAKASSLGIALLLLGIVFALERRTWALGILAFIYVWTHGGWPALLVVSAIAVLSLRGATRRSNLIEIVKTLGALIIGTVVGLIINPFFPQNLSFYWEQIVQIALVGYRDVIGVGGEWYPYGFANLMRDLPLLALLTLVAVVLVVIVLFRNSPHPSLGPREGDGSDSPLRLRGVGELWKALALTVIAAAFFVLTLRSRRHVEYFVPTAMLWLTFVLDRTGKIVWQRWGHNLREAVRAALPVVALAAVSVLGTFVMFARAELAQAGKDLASGYRFTLYRGAAEYLHKHAKPNEVVVHADWDDFPSLFYWDDAQHYVMGLDPTFMYREDAGRYQRYVDFTLGASSDPVGLMQELGSRWVFMDSDHVALRRMLKTNGRFVQRYADAEGYVFELK